MFENIGGLKISQVGEPQVAYKWSYLRNEFTIKVEGANRQSGEFTFYSGHQSYKEGKNKADLKNALYSLYRDALTYKEYEDAPFSHFHKDIMGGSVHESKKVWKDLEEIYDLCQKVGMDFDRMDDIFADY